MITVPDPPKSSRLVPDPPKSSRLERWEAGETARLAGRPEPVWCGTGAMDRPWPKPGDEPRRGPGCGYRLTTRRSGLCKDCESWAALTDEEKAAHLGASIEAILAAPMLAPVRRLRPRRRR